MPLELESLKGWPDRHDAGRIRSRIRLALCFFIASAICGAVAIRVYFVQVDAVRKIADGVLEVEAFDKIGAEIEESLVGAENAVDGVNDVWMVQLRGLVESVRSALKVIKGEPLTEDTKALMEQLRRPLDDLRQLDIPEMWSTSIRALERMRDAYKELGSSLSRPIFRDALVKSMADKSAALGNPVHTGLVWLLIAFAGFFGVLATRQALAVVAMRDQNASGGRDIEQVRRLADLLAELQTSTVDSAQLIDAFVKMSGTQHPASALSGATPVAASLSEIAKSIGSKG